MKTLKIFVTLLIITIFAVILFYIGQINQNNQYMDYPDQVKNECNCILDEDY